MQAELRNMTQGDKTPEFLAPVRLRGAREAYTESVLAFVAVVIGKLLFFPQYISLCFANCEVWEIVKSGLL